MQAGKSIEIAGDQLGELLDHLGVGIIAVMEAVLQPNTLGNKLGLGLSLRLSPIHRPAERRNPVSIARMFVRHTHWTVDAFLRRTKV